MWDTGAGSRLLNQGGGCPNEDLDVRDHRHARCGADRPAIIQTGTERPQPGDCSGRDHNKLGRSWPGSIAEALAWPRQTGRARGLKETTWPTVTMPKPIPKPYQKKHSLRRTLSLRH